MMDLHATTETTLAPEQRAVVIALVRYLDRVAFIPRDLVLAHASGQIETATFDRYRATCEHAHGAISDAIWFGVIDTLCTRALALGVRI